MTEEAADSATEAETVDEIADEASRREEGRVLTDSPTIDQPVPGLPGGGLIRLRLDIAYDGRDFAGWARQPHPPGLRTVQGTARGGVRPPARRRR